MARATVTLEFDGRRLERVSNTGGNCEEREIKDLTESEQELFDRADKAGLGEYILVLQTEDTARAMCCTICRLPGGGAVKCCWPC